MPRIAPAAVRVPELAHEPSLFVFPPGAPQIFVHEGARQTLERRLATAANQPVVLSITDNRHSMIRHARAGGVLRVRLHHMFLGSPPAVQEALVHYLVNGNRQASNLVGQYIDANLTRIKPRRRTAMQLLTRGKCHDLLDIFRSLNETYFDGAVDAVITWGRSSKRHGQSRKSIKLGGYNAVERLISIHPALDRPWVPRYFVSFVVFHEMLHHVVPAPRGGGRANLHPPAFREREATYRFYERALAWERSHISRMLRA
ncbi:MAG: hypothetical protein HY898_30335 [Deltaproteobacteria bacterium]|nr:hypothetical protein [Deltaproteobacteria bacterium]